MPESQLFFAVVAQWLDLVVLQYEISILAKQVVVNQIGIV